jgi:hypothetical protein
MSSERACFFFQRKIDVELSKMPVQSASERFVLRKGVQANIIQSSILLFVYFVQMNILPNLF